MVELQTAECENCKKHFAARVPVCPFCGHRKDNIQTETKSDVARSESSASTIPGAHENLHEPFSKRSPTPNDSFKSASSPGTEAVCPCCGGERGEHDIEVRTKELLNESLFSGRRRFLIKTWKVRGLCGACRKALHKRRYQAGALVLIPLIIFPLVALVIQPRLFAALSFLYLVYLVGGVNYSWADKVLYGAGDLEGRVRTSLPPETKGEISLPVGVHHVVVRILAIPLIVVAFLGTVSAWVSSAKPEPGQAATARTGQQDLSSEERVFQLLSSKEPLFMIMAPETEGSRALGNGTPSIFIEEQLVGGRKINEARAYLTEKAMAAGTSYEPMSGSQLLDAFLESRGHYLLFKSVDETLALSKGEAERMRMRIPAQSSLPVSVLIKR